MGGVFCPKCESSVEATAKFCLGCGHDFTTEGAITSTGHDLNQLKEVIRQREDLSMAEKFDMIAKVEEGANPITLGIAAAAVGEEDFEDESDSKKSNIFEEFYSFGESEAAKHAVRAVTRPTPAWGLLDSGKLNLGQKMYREAMSVGLDASTQIHTVASGEHDDIDAEAMRAIPVLKPPTRSFCPKCGSDIHANTLMQWRKWRDLSNEVLSIQLEASMEASIIQVAAHFVSEVETLEKKLKQLKKDHRAAKKKLDKLDVEELRKSIEEEIRPELEKEIRTELGIEAKSAAKGRSAAGTSKAKEGARKGRASSATKSKAVGKKPGLFGGGKKSTKTFEGADGDKPEWFLSEALDTVYDPHGTGKVLKRKTILARSSEGNVRVEDVVLIYSSEGEDGLSELAWTSPSTKYIIEAYDGC
ncbi:MAG TPA: zinc ribbon domain-containing protein [Candidatus Poseidoniales archaeon]|nr:zinc ribbon domain-containing protein [Candidatus Poseidoniales archaeon]